MPSRSTVCQISNETKPVHKNLNEEVCVCVREGTSKPETLLLIKEKLITALSVNERECENKSVLQGENREKEQEGSSRMERSQVQNGAL